MFEGWRIPPPAPSGPQLRVSSADQVPEVAVDTTTRASHTEDPGHKIHRSGGVWRIAHGLTAPNFLWYT